MIEPPTELTVREDWPRPTADQIAAFQNVPASIVSDAMNGRGALSAAIGPVLSAPDIPKQVAGPALTADNGPGNVLATLGALAYARPGDVLVASVSGFAEMAALGDRVAGMLANSGGVGLVTDGPVRDAAGLEQVGLPVWATGLTPATPHSNGPGRIGLPVAMAGQTIAPGDMIVADRDGVVVVPLAELDAVIATIAKVQQLETALDAEVSENGLTVPEPIREMLASDAVKRV